MKALSLALVAIVFLSACSPIQGYPGPALPDEQVSVVTRDYDSDQVEVSRASVNGLEFSWRGIAVLPGKQSIDFAIVTKERPHNCRPYSNFNSYGYEECLDEKYKKDRDNSYHPDCDCFDYLEVRQRCEQEVHDVNCSADVTTVAGRKYEAFLSKREDSATVTVREHGGLAIGSSHCSSYRTRDEDVDEYVGTGSITAHQYGFYRCF